MIVTIDGYAGSGKSAAATRLAEVLVFPHAPVKFFFTASAEVRARRRAAQDGLDPGPEDLADLIRQIAARDRQDETRAVDPLRKADDAVVIDTTELTPDEVLARMLEV